MVKVGTITGNEKVQNPNMEYCIELNDGRHLFSEKGFLELFNRMKVVVNNGYKHNVKTLVCGTCNTELNKIDNDMNINIDKREIWKAKDELTKIKTFSARMHYGFDKGVEFALEQIKNNCIKSDVKNLLIAYEKSMIGDDYQENLEYIDEFIKTL